MILNCDFALRSNVCYTKYTSIGLDFCAALESMQWKMPTPHASQRADWSAKCCILFGMSYLIVKFVSLQSEIPQQANNILLICVGFDHVVAGCKCQLYPYDTCTYFRVNSSTTYCIFRITNSLSNILSILQLSLATRSIYSVYSFAGHL